MPDLVRRGAAEVERRLAVPVVPNAVLQDHDAVGLRRAAGELRVAEQPAAAARQTQRLR